MIDGVLGMGGGVVVVDVPPAEGEELGAAEVPVETINALLFATTENELSIIYRNSYCWGVAV